jgi:hypothetical protein
VRAGAGEAHVVRALHCVIAVRLIAALTARAVAAFLGRPALRSGDAHAVCAALIDGAWIAIVAILRALTSDRRHGSCGTRVPGLAATKARRIPAAVPASAAPAAAGCGELPAATGVRRERTQRERDTQTQPVTDGALLHGDGSW